MITRNTLQKQHDGQAATTKKSVATGKKTTAKKNLFGTKKTAAPSVPAKTPQEQETAGKSTPTVVTPITAAAKAAIARAAALSATSTTEPVVAPGPVPTTPPAGPARLFTSPPPPPAKETSNSGMNTPDDKAVDREEPPKKTAVKQEKPGEDQNPAADVNHANLADKTGQIPITTYMKPRLSIGARDLTARPKITLAIRKTSNGYLYLVSIGKNPKGEGKHREFEIIKEALKKKNRLDKEFLDKSGCIAIVTKRKCKAKNEPVILNCPTWNKAYEDKYFACVMEPWMTLDSVLVAFQRLLQAHNIDAGITYPFDLTSAKRVALDNYLLDQQILDLLKMTWNGPVTTSFYKKNSVGVCNCFFSHPYPALASTNLGFPDKRDYYLTEKDLVDTKNDVREV